MIEICANYGPLKAGQVYRQLATGFDWVAISLKGRMFYVPEWAVCRQEDDE